MKVLLLSLAVLLSNDSAFAAMVPMANATNKLCQCQPCKCDPCICGTKCNCCKNTSGSCQNCMCKCAPSKSCGCEVNKKYNGQKNT